MLKINEIAPNFNASTTNGEVNFHEWIADSWVILFSHPKDFTPVCTTELGYMASIEGEFTKRNCKLIGLSIDSLDDHNLWKKDIEDVQGASVNYPLIADEDLKIAKLYNMLPAEEKADSSRTAKNNATVGTAIRYPLIQRFCQEINDTPIRANLSFSMLNRNLD